MCRLEKVEKAIEKGKEAALIKLAHDKDEEDVYKRQRPFTFTSPNQAWVGDITYIPTGEGWLYLAIVTDLCTKKIVGYAFSQRIDTRCV